MCYAIMRIYHGSTPLYTTAEKHDSELLVDAPSLQDLSEERSHFPSPPHILKAVKMDCLETVEGITSFSTRNIDYYIAPWCSVGNRREHNPGLIFLVGGVKLTLKLALCTLLYATAMQRCSTISSTSRHLSASDASKELYKHIDTSLENRR